MQGMVGKQLVGPWTVTIAVRMHAHGQTTDTTVTAAKGSSRAHARKEPSPPTAKMPTAAAPHKPTKQPKVVGSVEGSAANRKTSSGWDTGRAGGGSNKGREQLEGWSETK